MKCSTFSSKNLLLSLVSASAVLLTAYATAADNTQSSGFISPAVESKLKEVKLSDDREAQRWISTDMTSANYSAVMAMIEVRVTDSVSGDYRAAVKLDLQGKQLEGKADQLTLEDLQKSLDTGAAGGAKAIQEALAQ